MNSSLKVLIVAPNASAKFGGEAILPLHYFEKLAARNISVFMIVHERTKLELEVRLGENIEKVTFIQDRKLHQILCKLSMALPRKIGDFSFGVLLDLATQWEQRNIALKLIKQHDISVVHQPTPVSPKSPSMMYSMGVPVIIGPMNGGMVYPAAFAGKESLFERVFMRCGRAASNLINQLIPGKRNANTLLVANNRTRLALPSGCHGEVVELVENGVDLRVFKQPERNNAGEQDNEKIKLTFVGRLVGWKAIDILLDAVATIENKNFELHILGDGDQRINLQQQAKSLGIEQQVIFHGFLEQRKCAEFLTSCRCLVLPSLYECGGAVVLEAMALGVAVIASNWGGPADYLDDSCGILLDVSRGREAFKTEIAEAIAKVLDDPDSCKEMGRCGKQKIQDLYSWDKKIDSILEIYQGAIAG
ncbi:glycosyltransferase family 4 protein [Teredinibacter waterburyi]|uniref:glycosyltransferase family 4 protein n=1 Tax=Teredinibacter waterburyi TaxID=1500538 RepID=UPI00165FFF2A|nr:glycosyltransferase family 4 protein [Teredinibacter waterburyi]